MPFDLSRADMMQVAEIMFIQILQSYCTLYINDVNMNNANRPENSASMAKNSASSTASDTSDKLSEKSTTAADSFISLVHSQLLNSSHSTLHRRVYSPPQKCLQLKGEF